MAGRLNRQSVAWCLKYLGKDETMHIVRLAMRTETFRRKWIHKWGQVLGGLNEIVAQSLLNADEIFPGDQIKHEIEDFLMIHATSTVEKAFDTLADPRRSRLSSKPYYRRSLRELQKMYDQSRKGLLPTRIQILAKKLKRDYIQKCQSVWDKYSRDFREGKVFDQKLAVKVITEASDGVYSRGKMIVETETTRYYNMARKSYFDGSDDVTHYLFLAIMDVATTSWCKTRHRVVYLKGQKVTDIETPPCHWNCRSEMVPLTPLNPTHKKIIDNRSAQRENRRPEPLPRGWNK